MTKVAVATAQSESDRVIPEAPAAKMPAPKGTHRVQGELWMGRRRIPHGAELTLTDDEAEQLGTAVIKL